MKSPLLFLAKFDFIGVFALRLGLGAVVALTGFAPFIGGARTWKEIGSGLAHVGLGHEYLFLVAGLASVMVQVFGGFCLIVGLFTRMTALLLTIVVAIYATGLIRDEESLLNIFVTIQIALGFFALVFIGPGRFSLDRRGI